LPSALIAAFMKTNGLPMKVGGGGGT